MKLTKKEFKKWIKGLPKGFRFPIDYDTHSCPIASYLKEQDGDDHTVFTDGEVDGKVQRSWVGDFACNVDLKNDSKGLTREHCLKALKGESLDDFN